MTKKMNNMAVCVCVCARQSFIVAVINTTGGKNFVQYKMVEKSEFTITNSTPT